MSYELMWPDWADKTQDAIAAIMVELPDDLGQAARDLGVHMGDHLRSEFPDLDPGIVGWVAMRMASHLGSLAAQFPDITAKTVTLVGLLAGQHVEAGAR